MNPSIDCGSGREVSDAEARQYWRAALSDALPLLAFPTDFPRPARTEGHSATVRLPLTAGHCVQVRALCAQRAFGLDQLFLGLYQVFLQRYAGQGDIIVGLRPAPGAAPVPLRQQVDALLPFTELVERNARALEQARSYGPLPADFLPAAETASHAPLFQHLFSFPGGADAPAEPIGQFDTTLTVTDSEQGIDAVLRFNTSLFDAASSARWAANLVTLLASVCADPAAAAGELDLLHPDEKAFIAASLDKSAAPFVARFASVHAGFEQQAAKTPHAIALRCGALALTYAQLDARAGAIAQHLHLQGVVAGELVGICTARTADMVAAVIGVLKLGAAYVPMDTKYPALRLAAIADEARLKLVVCDARGRGLFGADGVRTVVLDEIPAAAPTFAPPVIGDDDLCHVIFTSGSTGTPKGVMARHRNVLAFLEWIYATYSREELAVVLCCSSLCFDLTVFELWGPLTVGGSVVLVDNPASLVQQAIDDLTLVNTVPTALRLIVDELALPRSVMAVNVCGEPLDVQLVNDLFQHYPHVVFYNTYGPTEDTAYSTFFKMTGPREGDPPIGAPIVHEYGRVVDPHGMQVPVGAIGDLLIGGAGVAKGYLYKPEATAARFAAATDYAGRAACEYRTGDFVRLLADGQLHFVGRRDDQVKLRGFRIDLGDVVNAVGLIPGVTDARVLVKRHKSGDVLVAYLSHSAVAPGGADAALQAQVEGEARARLPAFMVPSYFVLFDKLPLNDNGKVDRHALAAIDFDPQSAAVVDDNLSADERALADIWKPILGLEHIGRDDDFFHLGGNSLLAVRMVSRLNRAFGSDLPAQIVFEERTLATLAARARNWSQQALPALVRVNLADGVSPTYPQLAMLMDARKTSFNLCNAMWIDGPLDENALRGSVRGLLARHDALRTRFAMSERGAQMLIDADAADVLTVRTMGADATQVGIKAAIDAEWNHPFDLQQGLPVRALLLRLAPERHVFVLSVHHVATDEWSANIIKSDLACLYRAALDPSLAEPAFLPFRFGDYASWQAKLHGTEEFGSQLAYWAGEFARLRAVGGAFPPPVAANEDEGYAARFVQLAPAPASAEALAGLVARHRCTPYVVYLAALQLALAAHSGLDDQMVWTPVARRNPPELEESVGMYTNLTAILAYAGGEQRLDEFLLQVDGKVAQARKHGDVSALTALMQDPGLMPTRPMVGLNYIDLPNACDWAFEGTEVMPIPLQLEHEADICALELTVRVADGAAQLTAAYNTALFNGAQVADIGAALWRAVDAMWLQPSGSVAQLRANAQAELTLS